MVSHLSSEEVIKLFNKELLKHVGIADHQHLSDPFLDTIDFSIFLKILFPYLLGVTLVHSLNNKVGGYLWSLRLQ